MKQLRQALRWLVEYVKDPGFRRDLHCYGGLALLACGLVMVDGPGLALVVVGSLLFALPILIGALSRRSG